MLAFADHSNLAAHPGWCLRNLALVAGVTWHARRLRVLCVRSLSNGIGVDETRCSVLDIEIPELGSWWRGVARGPSEAGDGSSTAAAVDAVGWERDAKGRHRPRVVDLKSTMDPRCLASSAVDLNLRLMRWRVLPELDVETLNTTRCLLIGAGTLGCNVSRLLLAWGVRTLTFVDSGKVSYSNPVRQSLYTFKDCREGRPKAGVAADALKEVYPDVDAKGVCISVPMPGHPVAESEKRDLCESLDTLEELVQAHDVVFLLTDTRESRWLPTMLCTKHNKICINAALGFDAYVVLRHGAALSATNSSTDTASDDRLGCYFCNDVVAPLDSTVRFCESRARARVCVDTATHNRVYSGHTHTHTHTHTQRERERERERDPGQMVTIPYGTTRLLTCGTLCCTVYASRSQIEPLTSSAQ